MTDTTKVWMPEQPPKLEKLAKEIETMPNSDQLVTLIEHIRDNDYVRYKLIEEMRMAKLRYFARKLHIGFYDINRR